MKIRRNVLVCASCANELSAFGPVAGIDIRTGEVLSVSDGMDVLVSGVGAWLSTYNLTRALERYEYSLVVFVGICGVYDYSEPLGQVYVVGDCAFSDCGFEDEDGGFSPIVGSAFFPKDSFCMADGRAVNPYAVEFAAGLSSLVSNDVRVVTANTVQRCRTGRDYLEGMLGMFPADIETMESAAFAFVCLNEGQRFAEVRVSSNYVAPKAQKKWQVGPAISMVGEVLAMLDEECGMSSV